MQTIDRVEISHLPPKVSCFNGLLLFSNLPLLNPAYPLSHSTALAQSTSPPPSLSNPSTTLSLTHLENGNQKLEEGDVEGAKKEYERSVEVEGTGAGWYNLGVSCETSRRMALFGWEWHRNSFGFESYQELIEFSGCYRGG